MHIRQARAQVARLEAELLEGKASASELLAVRETEWRDERDRLEAEMVRDHGITHTHSAYAFLAPMCTDALYMCIMDAFKCTG